MNKKTFDTNQEEVNDDMLPEYDFTGGVRGKHYRAYHQGYTVTVHHSDGTTSIRRYQPEAGFITLDPDVRRYFPDSKAANNALRGLIALIPEQNHVTEST